MRFALKTMFGLKIVSEAKTMSVSTRVRPEHRFKHRNFAPQSTASTKLSALGILDLAETPNPCPKHHPHPHTTASKFSEYPETLRRTAKSIKGIQDDPPAVCLEFGGIPRFVMLLCPSESRAQRDSQHNILV
jgi:hypothetical protein